MAKVTYPEGVYSAKIMQHVLTTSEQGNDVFLIQMRVEAKVDEADPAKQTACDPVNRSIRMSVTGKTWEWIGKTLDFLGFDQRDHDIGINAFDHRNGKWSIIGKQILVYCKHSTDHLGDTREDWGISRGVGVPDLDNDKDRSHTESLLLRYYEERDQRRGNNAPKRQPAPAPEPARPVKESSNPFLDDSPLPGGDGLNF